MRLKKMGIKAKTSAGLTVFCLLFCLTVSLLSWATPARAAQEGDGGIYTIRILAGAKGKLTQGADGGVLSADGSMLEYRLPYGTRMSFQAQERAVPEKDSKYYVKGIWESGRERAVPSFTVTEDRDFVVAYGIRGNMVAYTVNYVDGEGNELAPSGTYYGNVGDRPVVAFIYLEGWQPQAYNLTKTLAEDASLNVFTFVYARAAAGTQAGGSPSGGEGGAAPGTVVSDDTGTEGGAGAPGEGAAGIPPGAEVPAPGGDNVPGGGIAPGGAGGPDGAGVLGAPGGDNTPGGNEEPGGNEDPGGEDNQTVIPDENVPRELVNLDDNEEVPLADIGDLLEEDGKNPKDKSLFAGRTAVIAAAAAVAAVGAILFLLIRKKKKRKEKNG